jgi:MFS transporter, YNFM family, putative membrane transport protein
MGPFLFGATAMFAAMYSTQAILPDLGAEFGVTPSQAGLTVSVVIGALAVGAWFWGPLSDRIGRRASLELASAAIVVPTLLAALAPSFGTLLAVRALQGLCMPGLLTVGVPYVTEAFTARIGERAMGYYVTSLVAGGLIGRVAVALMTAVAGWRVALAALALLPLASTIVMRRSLPPEPEAPARSGGFSARKLTSLLRNPTLMAATLVGSTMFFTFMGVFSYVDYRLERPPFSLGQATAGLIFLLWAMGAAGPLAGRLAGSAGWARVAFGAVALAALGLTVSLVSTLAVVVVGLALVTLGNFSGVTAAQIGVGASTEQDRGLASALYFSSYYLAGAIGCWLPGLAWERWEWPGVAGIGLAAYALALTGLALSARRTSGA